MEFNYGDHFGSEPSTGCELLQYGAMIGDIMLVQRNDIVEAAWTMAPQYWTFDRRSPRVASPTIRCPMPGGTTWGTCCRGFDSIME